VHAREAKRPAGGIAVPAIRPESRRAAAAPTVRPPVPWDFSTLPIHDEGRPVPASPPPPRRRSPVGRAASGSEAAREEEATRLARTSAARRLLDGGTVRFHADARARRATHALGASAFTLGRDVFVDPGVAASPGADGLVAHELGHVAAGHGALSRAVSPDYARIRKNLSYNIVDWAITDAEAREVLDLLSTLSPGDLADTIAAMEAEGLVSRLLENVSEGDRAAYSALIDSVHRARGAETTSKYIERLLSYGLLDWVVTDAEAHLALDALLTLRPTPPKLRDVVTKIPKKQYERFYDNLSDRDRSANLRFLQELEMMRSSGLTLDELTARQRKFVEDQATAGGKTVGEYVGGEAAAHGYGGNPVTWWPSLAPALKAAWIGRFNDLVARVKREAPRAVRKAIEDAERGGGGIKWSPEEEEEYNFFGAHIDPGGKHWLLVGRNWVEAGEKDLTAVYDNIAHELGGHGSYGDEVSWEIMRNVIAGFPAAERAKAEGGARKPWTAYGYPETELYAELRELPYRVPATSESDDPRVDVERQLNRIKAAFEPRVAEAIVRGLRRRIQADDMITGESRALFDEKVKVVFGITF
jgi:hypothetical protein